jgi:glycosyltransferase involved in cell wall biosynthesis
MVKIAVVVPRYGREVNGGAETLAREYATRLAERHEVTVLTTCALDYRTWADHFPAGESTENGVGIVRFPVPQPRDGAAFDALSAQVLTAADNTSDTEGRWMDAQGPNSPALLDHLRNAGDRYDVVLFIPYLYATTVRGLPLVADRAVLVPAFHDEPPLRLGIFDSVVQSAKALVFSTPEEQELARRRFRFDEARLHLVGAGIDTPPEWNPSRGAQSIGVTRPYVVCVGRIDPSKGSDELIRAHRDYRRGRPDGVDLVMLGRPVMDLPKEKWLHTPGFVDEQTKHDLIAGARALVAPSPYESLSLVLLEAWSNSIPTIASARSPILVGQTRRSGGGLWYRNAAEYAACVDLLDKRPPLAGALGRAGWRFAQTLTWPTVIEALERAVGVDQGSEAEKEKVPDGVGPPRSAVAGLPGGSPQVAVDADAWAASDEALHGIAQDAVLYFVTDVIGEPPARAVRLPRSPEVVLATRLALMDVVVTADPKLAVLARRAAPTVPVLSPEDRDLVAKLAHAVETARPGE